MSEMGSGGPSRHGDEAGGMTDTIQEQASEMKEKGANQVRLQLDERTTQVGHQARSFADVLRRSGTEQGSNGGSDGVERVTSGIADRLERIGGYLEQAKGDDMLRDAERFARQRPWVVAGSAALVGLAASRLLKASSESRYEQRASGSSGQSSSSERYGERSQSEPVAVGSSSAGPRSGKA